MSPTHVHAHVPVTMMVTNQFRFYCWSHLNCTLVQSVTKVKNICVFNFFTHASNNSNNRTYFLTWKFLPHLPTVKTNMLVTFQNDLTIQITAMDITCRIGKNSRFSLKFSLINVSLSLDEPSTTCKHIKLNEQILLFTYSHNTGKQSNSNAIIINFHFSPFYIYDNFNSNTNDKNKIQ